MKKIIVYTVVIILLFLGIVISLTNSQRGRKKVKTELSLVEKQSKEEDKKEKTKETKKGGEK